MKKSDYKNTVEAMFNDRREFKEVPVDPSGETKFQNSRNIELYKESL